MALGITITSPYTPYSINLRGATNPKPPKNAVRGGAFCWRVVPERLAEICALRSGRAFGPKLFFGLHDLKSFTRFGSCPHPSAVHDRGHIEGYILLYFKILEVLMTWGSIQVMVFKLIVPLKWIEYGGCGDLIIIIYPKPYSIYLTGTILGF